MSVCPYAWYNSARIGWIFTKFDKWAFFFQKSVEEIQVPSKSDKNNEDLCTFLIVSRYLLLRIINFLDKIVNKIRTHILRRYILEIAGFRRGWTEFFLFLGHYEAWDDFKPTFRYYLSVPPTKVKLGPIGSWKTSVSNNLTPLNNPEAGSIQELVCQRCFKAIDLLSLSPALCARLSGDTFRRHCTLHSEHS